MNINMSIGPLIAWRKASANSRTRSSVKRTVGPLSDSAATTVPERPVMGAATALPSLPLASVVSNLEVSNFRTVPSGVTSFWDRRRSMGSRNIRMDRFSSSFWFCSVLL